MASYFKLTLYGFHVLYVTEAWCHNMNACHDIHYYYEAVFVLLQ